MKKLASPPRPFGKKQAGAWPVVGVLVLLGAGAATVPDNRTASRPVTGIRTATQPARGTVHSAAAQATRPAPPPIDGARWDAMDMEARWLAYVTSAPDAAKRKQKWVQWLTARKDYRMLEWIAVFDGYPVAGPALVQARAPNWIRCAVWGANNPDSHTFESAIKDLEKNEPDLVYSWLKRYPVAIRGKLRGLWKKLVDKKPKLVDIGGQAPPLLPQKILLPYLQAPRRLATLSQDAQRSDPGKTYVHQVLRAIEGLVYSGLRSAAWQDRLLGLTRHRNSQVRRAAFLAFTRMPPSPQMRTRLLSVVRGSPDEKDVRDALLAASYIEHPEVFMLLHHVARSPQDPAWTVALSRLAELGNDFTLRHLKSLEAELDSARRRDLLDRHLKRIEAREARVKPAQVAGRVQALLELAAWTELVDDPLADTLIPWTRRELREWTDEATVRLAIGRLQQSYDPASHMGTPEQRAELRERVRALAGSILR